MYRSINLVKGNFKMTDNWMQANFFGNFKMNEDSYVQNIPSECEVFK